MKLFHHPAVLGEDASERAVLSHLFDKETNKLVARLLQERLIARPGPWHSQRGRLVIFAIVLLVSLALVLVYQWWLFQSAERAQRLPNGAQVGAACVAAIVSFFAYVQWIEARRETSLDKFYDRLKLVNDQYCEWPEARELVAHSWEAGDERNFRRCMYVYVELDNLEYILTRFRLGFVTRGLLERAIRTFRWRCISPEFMDLAVTQVESSGYQPTTVNLVQAISRSVGRPERRSSHDRRQHQRPPVHRAA